MKRHPNENPTYIVSWKSGTTHREMLGLRIRLAGLGIEALSEWLNGQFSSVDLTSREVSMLRKVDGVSEVLNIQMLAPRSKDLRLRQGTP